ncbi:MAG: hypothetical protein ACOCWY_04855 [Thermodesulfobacteriota bacterium]
MSQFKIPWDTPDQWAEINRTFGHLLRRRHADMKPARDIAGQIESRMADLFPLMSELCRYTCPECREPCCRVATLWYNFQDLLFLHLTEQAVPESQPLRRFQEPCRYLGPRGCILDRMARPWICTWYICPPQTVRLRKMGRIRRQETEAAMDEIKALRHAMEETFIDILFSWGTADGEENRRGDKK